MKKALLLIAVLAMIVQFAYAKPVSSEEIEFDWAALFVIDVDDIDYIEADDDWLLEYDCDGGYVYGTEAVMVFSWDEVSGGDFYVQFRINDADGDDIWSDEFEFGSSDDYMVQKWLFDVDLTGTYDFYVYINGYEWYHGSFESE